MAKNVWIQCYFTEETVKQETGPETGSHYFFYNWTGAGDSVLSPWIPTLTEMLVFMVFAWESSEGALLLALGVVVPVIANTLPFKCNPQNDGAFELLCWY